MTQSRSSRHSRRENLKLSIDSSTMTAMERTVTNSQSDLFGEDNEFGVGFREQLVKHGGPVARLELTDGTGCVG